MRAQDEALKRGVTGVESLEQASSYAALQRARGRGDLKVRALMGIPHRSLAAFAPLQGLHRRSATRLRFDFDAALRGGCAPVRATSGLQLGHVKFFTDGALGSQTAALEDPYEGTEDRGILTFDPMELRTGRRARRGGRACRRDTRDRRSRGARRARRDRTNAYHVARTSPATRTHPARAREDLGRFGALGIIASMQPIHCRAIAISPIATGDRSARRALIRGGPFSIEAPFSRSVRTPRSNPSIPARHPRRGHPPPPGRS